MTRRECVTTAGQILARARARRDALPPEEAARLAHYPGGPSLDAIAHQIRVQRGLAPEVSAA